MDNLFREILEVLRLTLAGGKISMSILELKILSTLPFFVAGIVGAVLKDILEDNSVQLPAIKDGKLVLGFIGGAIVGGFAGIFIDESVITAFMGGYTGRAIIEKLIATKTAKAETAPEEPPAVPISSKEEIEKLIRKIAVEEKVDSDLAVRVAKCESGLNPKAINVNGPGSVDRGLYQINSKWHPEVTDEQAFDVVFAIKFFCSAVRAGKLSMWDASKNCWNK